MKEPLVHVGYEAAWVPVLVGCTSVINRLLLELNTQCDLQKNITVQEEYCNGPVPIGNLRHFEHRIVQPVSNIRHLSVNRI